MQKRELGRSGLDVSVVGLGCWVMGGWMWGGTEDDDSVAAIRRAVELGVTFIDTAPVYGHGHSEEVVGRALEGMRDDVILATKCGLVWPPRGGREHFVGPDGVPIFHNLEPDSIIAECEDSLRRLRTDVIDVYQCHWPDPGSSLDDSLAALTNLQEQGKIRAIGVSNFTVAMMEQCLSAGRIESDQPQYNMLDRKIEREILPFCRENGIGIIAYSPLNRGLLTGKVTMDRVFEEGDHRAGRPWFQPHNRRRVLDFLEKVRPIADGHGATLAQLAANWVIAQDGVSTAICGARRAEQVEENVKAADFELTAEELAEIDRLLEELGAPTKA
jgi:aryl-alcohol dehydrogenase-like predicted oxidoreductase